MFDSSIHAKRKGVKTIFLLQHEKRNPHTEKGICNILFSQEWEDFEMNKQTQ